MCYGPYKSAQLFNEENFVATFEYNIFGVRKDREVLRAKFRA